MFLKAQEAYIGHLGTIPDTWRGYTEPYLRISEDANHGWYTEQIRFHSQPAAFAHGIHSPRLR